MREITLRDLIDNCIIDEDQRIICYCWQNGNGWVRTYKGFARDLRNDDILDSENISLGAKNVDYIAVYYN